MLNTSPTKATMKKYFLKTNRTFSAIRKHSWILVPVVAFGSLYYPLLGIFVFAVMMTIMITGVFQGRYWCGNLCPHGSLFDRLAMPISLFKRIPRIFRLPVVRWGFFAFYMILFGIRLARIIPLWGNPEFLGRFGTLMGRQYLVMPTIVGFTLSVINPRVWCSVCPMGSFGHVMYKLGTALKINKAADKRVSIEAVEKCHKCATCARVCPLQLEPFKNFDENNQFSNELCIRCGTCVTYCPAEQLKILNTKNISQVYQTSSLEGYDKRVSVSATIADIRNLSDNVKQFTFQLQRKPEESSIDYKAGQFVLVKICSDPEVFRAYSISSMQPDDPDSLSVTIQRVQDGFASDIVFDQFYQGMSVELEGPMGHELIVDKTASKVLLIAGGIGITPFVPIVKDLTQNPGEISDATLLYGVNKQDDFLYDDFFLDLHKQHSFFHYKQTVASPTETWEGNTGFVTNTLKTMDLSNTKVYMCGPPPMVKAVLNVLKEMKNEGCIVNFEDIFYESA